MKKIARLLTVAVMVLSTLLIIGTVNAETIPVSIDIKPGSCPNSINLKSRGVVPVSIMTTGSFDATTVDPTTVLFAGAPAVRWTIEDVQWGDNQPPDGDLDLLLFFKTQELALTPGDTSATLTGNTFGGDPISGTGSVNIVPK